MVLVVSIADALGYRWTAATRGRLPVVRDAALCANSDTLPSDVHAIWGQRVLDLNQLLTSVLDDGRDQTLDIPLRLGYPAQVDDRVLGVGVVRGCVHPFERNRALLIGARPFVGPRRQVAYSLCTRNA